MKLNSYPILITVWALGCVNIPLFTQSSNYSIWFLPLQFSPLPAQVSLTWPVCSTSLHRSCWFATCWNQGYQASIREALLALEGQRTRALGWQPVTLQWLSECWDLPLFSVKSHISQFHLFIMWSIFNCLCVDSNLAVAPSV